MKNVPNVNSDEFGIELEKCLSCGVASNKLGRMFLKLADNAVHSKALGVFNDDVISEAKGFLIEFMMESFTNGRRAKDSSKHLAYYFAMSSNYLRKFASQRLGRGSNMDLLGGNISRRLSTVRDNKLVTPVRFIEWQKYIDFYEPYGLNRDGVFMLFLIAAGLTKVISG